MFKRHKREALTLRRDLGLVDATLAGVGIIVGAGIYVLIGIAAGHAGNAIWLSFLISAVVALLTGFSYAELSSIYADSSGEYSYVEHNFNKRIAFVVGYLVMISLVIGAAAVTIGFVGYLNPLLGLKDMIPTAVITIILFSIINFLGTKQSMVLNIIFTSLSILGLLVIIGLSLPRLGTVNYFELPENLTGVFKAASLIFFAYIGFESVVKLSEETKNPRKIIPLSLMLSIGITTVLYIAVAFCAISILGWQQLSKSTSPMSDVAAAVMGSHMGVIIALIAIVSTGNTILLSLVAMSRMLYSMSKDYVKLHFLSAVSPATKTPYVAVILTCLLTISLVFIGDINMVAEITNFTAFAVFAIVNLALIRSRYRKHRHEMFHEPLNIGKFPLLALLGLVSCILMMFNLQLAVLIIGGVLILSGFAFYRILEA